MYRLALCEQFSIFFIYTIHKYSVPVNIPYTFFYASDYHYSLVNAEMFVRNAG